MSIKGRDTVVSEAGNGHTLKPHGFFFSFLFFFFCELSAQEFMGMMPTLADNKDLLY